MKSSVFAIGTPVLLALMIISLVSLGARVYHDHGFSAAVQAETTR